MTRVSGTRFGLIPAHAGKTSRRTRPREKWWAHPRSRGENGVRVQARRTSEGSSPLTRGKRVFPALALVDVGLIPASSCGTPSQGSSPLTRGKPGCAGFSRSRRGLIPAHAGKTERLGLTVPTIRAHPRSRGENPTLLITTPHVQGSSPLTRGKPTRAATVTAPARAHPRSRGENQDENIINLSKQGSSPLTRGKREILGGDLGGGGLIPAHAGKTQRGLDASLRAGAHPRSRGENLRLYGLGALNEGSSPLTRGKLVTLPRLADEQGLIPAHAGKTGCQVLRLGRRRAHPRSRGENGVAGAKRCVTPGSSPLTRGKQSLS